MEVPRPPLTFNTASLLRFAGVPSGSFAYGTILSSEGELMRSQSLQGHEQMNDACRWGRRVQILAASAVGKITSEEVEEGLHLGVEGLDFDAMRSISIGRAEHVWRRRTFFVSGSETVLTSAESSLRIALAATPVVEVLKSM